METTNNNNDSAIKIRAAHKDYNARGKCRAHWYRLVWRDGSWQYFSQGRLSAGNFLAHERHGTTYGDVFEGEIVITHAYGGPVDSAWVVGDRSDKPLKKCELEVTRTGLRITTPAGDVFETPNPRR